MKNKKKSIKLFSFSARDGLLTALIILSAFAVCFLLKNIDDSSVAIPMIFILAVFLISRFTTGYLYGTVASFVSVLGVNYVFTYPYFQFNFTLSGYPVTIISMLAVAIITSALTTQIKHQETIRIEVEREKTRSNLLRSISHDLRTPLTSILGASSAIIENDDVLTQKERLKLLSEVKEDAQWLIRMVENLLSITRIDNEREAKIIKQPEALEEVIAEATEKFKKRFPDIKLLVHIPDELLMIPMDALLIQQVLINLLENATIHSKITTEIEINVLSKDNYAVFKVQDNGTGISNEVLPHIFEGYFKKKYEDEGDSKRNMGIGLSVCYTIIHAHGGTMTAENAQSGGAIFRFTLPLEVKIHEQ